MSNVTVQTAQNVQPMKPVQASQTSLSFVNDARVMAKGQVTIPKNIRNVLGISTGDRVTFVVDNGEVKVINSAIYALKLFQQQMSGKAEAAGLLSDEDIANWITDGRHEEESEASAITTTAKVSEAAEIHRISQLIRGSNESND